MKTRKFPTPAELNAKQAQLVPPVRIDPLTGKPLPARGKKHGNQPCEDREGNKFPSLGERRIFLAFKDCAAHGDCSEPERKKYVFIHEDEKIGSYTSDINITAYRNFHVDTEAARYEFEAGRDYVIDVKSQGTVTIATQMRFKCMYAFHKIKVFVMMTKPPRPKRAKKKEYL